MKYRILLLSFILAGYMVDAQPNTTLFEINPGSGHGDPVGFTYYNGKLYFYADDGTHGIELWYTDSWAPPQMVHDLGPKGCLPGTVYIRGKMGVVNGLLYFMGSNDTLGYELYNYNGSGLPGITKDYLPGNSGMPIDYLVSLQNKLYYRAVHDKFGSELTVYDPASNTINLVADLVPGYAGSDLKDLTVYDNKIYFSAATNNTGNELFVYDPASNNVQLVADLNNGVQSSSPKGLVVIGGKLYFSAVTASYGRELYAYSGSGTPVRLTDLNPGAGDGVLAASPMSIGYLYTGVYFAGSNSGNKYQLYKYEPATNSTSLVYAINATGSSEAAHFCVYINKLFFSADDGVNGKELWVYDGEHTPKMVADINTGAGSSHPAGLTEVNGSLCFNANNGSNGRELYRYTDPTAELKAPHFDGDISVYPNPVITELNFNIALRKAEKLSIRLSNSKGNEIYNSGLMQMNATINKVSVPVQDLVGGSYFYYLCSESGQVYATGNVIRH